MKRPHDSPKVYRDSVTGDQREMLEKIRKAIFDVAPHAGESIRHGMLDYPGICNLGAQKHYVALYVMPEVLARHAMKFEGADCGKSCLRFRRPEQIKVTALRSLLRDVRRTRNAAG